jgi:DNA-binding beta-propeller fold protein YncE
MVLRQERSGMIDFLIITAAGFGLMVGFIFLLLVIIFLANAWSCIIDAMAERPNRLTNVRIRERIVKLMASGFAPTLAQIYGGAGVAVDDAGKRVFLANAKVMKLYGIEDVINVESDFADEFPPKASAIRLWVRDLESTFFGITDMTSTKLREIDSLLSVMLESRAAEDNSLLPQSVIYELEQIG